MKQPLIIFKNGTIKREQNTLFFIEENGSKHVIPIEAISEIEIFGEINFNKRVLEFLTKKKIPVHFYNYYGYYTGTYYPREHLNSGYVILKQAEHYLDYDLRLFIAKMFVYGAYRNTRQNLINYKCDEIVEIIDFKSSNIDKAATIEELMAIEGNIKEAYYSGFNQILKQFSFEKREKRPPDSEINAMISFGNTLLYTKVLSEIYFTHLDPRIGYLHETNNRSFSLNLDIAEIFKPVIVDRLIFNLVNRKIIRKEHFEKEAGAYFLNEQGKRIFVQAFESRLKDTIKHRRLNRKVSLQRLIRLECYKLVKHLIQDEIYEPFVMRW
ncbi:type I-B CRISPR-associated endonuclease Cas1b [Desulfurobacterium atlanticum]|uniref:CRISPR-associated endonuclease Cas1 n=1 Tax=Desulfurobacterium atlanticum TaxID=240169 RepID=A0A239A455_9BACT|nr:type I-B CRISPR-associated endonuclease Cas1b [Desulfurobacterium atlanticum]SNR89693.1 CRISP-associated protein Cas1 [Desulfurobacterium atlanticum]